MAAVLDQFSIRSSSLLNEGKLEIVDQIEIKEKEDELISLTKSTLHYWLFINRNSVKSWFNEIFLVTLI